MSLLLNEWICYFHLIYSHFHWMFRFLFSFSFFILCNHKTQFNLTITSNSLINRQLQISIHKPTKCLTHHFRWMQCRVTYPRYVCCLHYSQFTVLCELRTAMVRIRNVRKMCDKNVFAQCVHHQLVESEHFAKCMFSFCIIAFYLPAIQISPKNKIIYKYMNVLYSWFSLHVLLLLFLLLYSHFAELEFHELLK